MGEHGTSELKIVDKVYNDSVRDVFRRSTAEAFDDEEEYEPDPTIKEIADKLISPKDKDE